MEGVGGAGAEIEKEGEAAVSKAEISRSLKVRLFYCWYDYKNRN